MQSCTVSTLLPNGKHVQYYESFVLQYSLIVSSNLIIYELINQSTEDQIFSLFEKYHGQMNDYDYKRRNLLSMMIESNAPQHQECRGLLLDKFFLSMSIDKKKPKEILLSFVNAKEFLLLYAVFEGVLKSEFEKTGVLKNGTFLREKDIPLLLIKKLNKNKNDGLFLGHLTKRSPLSTHEELAVFWDFFTHFRHLYAHSGGYVTIKWLEQYKSKREKLINTVNNFDCAISGSLLTKSIENIEAFENKMFYIEDGFSNIFRNFIIYIMESLYLTENV